MTSQSSSQNIKWKKVHCFVISDVSLKRKNTNVNTKFIFSRKFRALKYMTMSKESAFLCVFRSSGANNTEIIHKKYRKLYMSV